jgi:predicted MFS family arabinose efflux permease
VLLAICLLSGHPMRAVVLGLSGLSGVPVPSSMAVRFAGAAPRLGVAMSVWAYNLCTAVGSGITGATSTSGRGPSGPAVVAP